MVNDLHLRRCMEMYLDRVYQCNENFMFSSDIYRNQCLFHVYLIHKKCLKFFVLKPEA